MTAVTGFGYSLGGASSEVSASALLGCAGSSLSVGSAVASAAVNNYVFSPGGFSPSALRQATDLAGHAATAGILLELASTAAGLASAYDAYAQSPTSENLEDFALALGKTFFQVAFGAMLLNAGFSIPAIALALSIGGLGFQFAEDLFGRPLLNYLKAPLILDLDGDGIELISLANSDAHLDYGGDGFAERTGWVKGDDGILVFDRNANGSVDGIGEMFGSATQDGFEVLETLDTNHDGKIILFARLRHDAAEAEFANRRVWQDANEDGISDAGELKTLAELGRMRGRLLVGNWRRSRKTCRRSFSLAEQSRGLNPVGQV